MCKQSAPLVACSTSIALHEVALNSIHAHGRLLDRQALKVEGECLLQMVADGRLLPAQRLDFAFEALPLALRQLKDASASGKWVTRLD